jgi:hypothetical protein
VTHNHRGGSTGAHRKDTSLAAQSQGSFLGEGTQAESTQTSLGEPEEEKVENIPGKGLLTSRRELNCYKEFACQMLEETGRVGL